MCIIEELNKSYEKSVYFEGKASEAYESLLAHDGRYDQNDVSWYRRRSEYYYGRFTALDEVLEGFGFTTVQNEDGTWVLVK